jgi:glycine cleavage system aminomethyltransferase T
VVYTQWLNERGGIEADLTITRRSEQDFLVVTAAATRTRDLSWLSPARARASGRDRGHHGGVRRPRRDGATLARAALQADVVGSDQRRLPLRIGPQIELAGIDTLALRMSYVGELGWELYVPAGDATTVYDAVVTEGAQHGLRHAGFHAMNSLRLEAGYRHWGDDLTDQDTPLEAGLGFAVAFDKPRGFIGREALVSQRDRPRTRRLVQFRLEDPERLLYHDEPILRDGELVGRTCSGMWSYTEDRALAMGYVEAADAVDAAYVADGSWEIEVAGEPIPATASLRSFYDPRSQRPRG